MAARFAFRFSKQHFPAAAACAAAAGAAGSGRIHQRSHWCEEVIPPESAANLKPFHVATWRDPSPGMVREHSVNTVINPMFARDPHMNFLNPNEKVQGHIIMNDSKKKSRPPALAQGCVRANACKEIYWEPCKVKAAVVTCGGLCPGLNSIIREVTKCLIFQYGVNDILGIEFGYNGLSDPLKYPPRHLDTEYVREIHMKGGSVLQAGRGGFDAEKICDNLDKMGVNMLFVIGGDGTQAAANLLYLEAKKRNMPLSIVGVPKSIDNDVLHFDRTFGFDSAVATANQVIRNAWVEATSCYRGVGIVKLMGRDAGFVAMNTALSSTIVDLCLIPEVKFKMEDVHTHIDDVLARKGFMVIAVAEGAGQDIVSTGKKDATGHTVYGDIGTYLRDDLNKYLKASGGRSFYIDPSYIIRSVPADPNDHIFCGRMARDAVHTAMRGYSGVCVGPMHNIMVIVPSTCIRGKSKVKIHSSNWQACVQVCHMPQTLSGSDAA